MKFFRAFDWVKHNNKNLSFLQKNNNRLFLVLFISPNESNDPFYKLQLNPNLYGYTQINFHFQAMDCKQGYVCLESVEYVESERDMPYRNRYEVKRFSINL